MSLEHPKKRRFPPPTPDFSIIRDLKGLGYPRIIGVDEVGRGAVAGPVVVAAVEVSNYIDGITDSKHLSTERRWGLAQILHRDCDQIQFGSASNDEIDELGMGEALKLAYQRALSTVSADLVLTDHFNLPTEHRFIRATRGDSLFYPVAAASIVAKVYRDQLMCVYGRIFADYGWHHNAGYGTAFHLDVIRQIGPSPLHRKTFLNH